jgi:cysteine-rich repeat protein
MNAFTPSVKIGIAAAAIALHEVAVAAPDVSGTWRVALSGGSETGETVVQAWSQTGSDLTVTDPYTGRTFEGQIDDQGYFLVRSTSGFCIDGPPVTRCCGSSGSYTGQLSADGSRWEGQELRNYPTPHVTCLESFSNFAAGTRAGNGVLDPSEQCDDGNVEEEDGCDGSGQVEACWQCTEVVPGVCTAQVKSCTGGGDGGVSLRADVGSRGPRLRWKLPGGPASTPSLLGDPTSTTTYALCVYDRSGPEPTVLLSADAPAGEGWRQQAGGFSFKAHEEEAAHGVTSLSVRSGEQSKASVRLQGANLTMPPLPWNLPLTVQLHTSDAGCFEAPYSSTELNELDKLRAKADPPSP